MAGGAPAGAGPARAGGLKGYRAVFAAQDGAVYSFDFAAPVFYRSRECSAG